MAISLAQAIVVGTGNNVDSLNVSYGSSTTGSNRFIVMVRAYVAANGALGTSIVSDNKSNTYTRDHTGGLVGANTYDVAFYSASGAGGASHQVTVNPAGTGNYLKVSILEAAGVAASYAGQTANGTGSSTTKATGSLGGSAAAGDLQLAAVVYESNETITVESVSPAWTQIEEDNNTTIGGESDYRVLTGSTTAGCSWATSGSATYRAISYTYVAAVVAASIAAQIVNGGRVNRGLINAGRVN